VCFYLKDVIDDRLDSRQFPSVGGQRNTAGGLSAQRYLSPAHDIEIPLFITSNEIPKNFE
jgi:hypothetical protein